MYEFHKSIREAEPEKEKKKIDNITLMEELPTDVEYNQPICIYDS